jgi:hypothetical protein
MVVTDEEGPLTRADSTERNGMGWARSLMDDDLEEPKG